MKTIFNTFAKSRPTRQTLAQRAIPGNCNDKTSSEWMKKLKSITKIIAILWIFTFATHLHAQTAVTETGGTTKFVPIWGTVPNLINSQIIDNGTTGGSGGIGINTTSTSSYLNMLVPHVSGKEQCFQIGVDDASADFFKIMNGTVSDNIFEPYIWGHCETVDYRIPLALIATTSATEDDNTTTPIMTFGARRWNGTYFSNIIDRPLFTWYNNDTIAMQMNALGSLGIGTTSPNGRLDIFGIGSTSSTYAITTENASSTSLFVVRNDGNVGIGTSSPSAQLDQELSSSGSLTGILSNSTTSSGASVTSIAATATNNGVTPGNNSTGVSGTGDLNSAASQSTAYGVYGTTGCGGSNNTYYGVYGTNSCVGGAGNTYYGVFCQGNGAYTGTWTGPSDIKLKDNIQPFTGAMENIMKLQPKSYIFRTKEFPSLNLSYGPQVGLISQDVEQIFPNLVRNDRAPATLDKNGKVIYPSVDFKGINYIGFVPVIISAMQEQQGTIQQQQATIAAQQTQNAQLQNSVSDLQDKYNTLLSEMEQVMAMQAQCCGNIGANTTSGMSDQPSLAQNVPNPFAQNTMINYYLPASMPNAVISVHSMTGVIVKSFNINTPGNGQVTITGSTLAPGTYEYDMTVNGKLIDSKKMVIIGE